MVLATVSMCESTCTGIFS